MRTIIVGGVAGGMSAATRLRRLDETADIVIFERGDHVSFANCGLPYYLGGVITRRQDLLLQTPASLAARFRLDVRVRHEVTAIDPNARTVTVTDLDSGAVRTEPYDHLVLSLGAAPVRPPIPGIERALTLRDVADVDQMLAASQAAAAAGARAVVIGAGFIGVEVVENLRHRGLSVTLVELADQVLPPLEPELAALVADELIAHDVRLRLRRQVVEIGPDRVTLDDGESVPADLVVAAIGVRPQTDLATTAGVTLGPNGGILVDHRMATNVPGIYAVGDMVEKHNPLTGTSGLVPLANVANKQGRRVADAIAGLTVPEQTRDAVGTAVVGVFGLTAAATGLNTRRAAAAQLNAVAIHTHPASHAGYYPGATPMHLVLLIEPGTGRILGAQGVGGEAVARRIDVLATAIQGGLTAVDLIDLEVAYAPQYGSAKDAVNQLGYVADGVLSTERIVGWRQATDVVTNGGTLLDVRTAGEFAAGAIPGARNIPVDELRDRHGELPQGPVTVYCQVGQRGHVATRLLTQLGYQVANLDGGYLTWSAGQRATSLAQG